MHWSVSKEPAEGSDFTQDLRGATIAPSSTPHCRQREATAASRAACQDGTAGPVARKHAVYILVDDLAKAATNRRRRGKIPDRGAEGSGMGKFSLFTDPEGRMMGLWKAKSA